MFLCCLFALRVRCMVDAVCAMYVALLFGLLFPSYVDCASLFVCTCAVLLLFI